MNSKSIRVVSIVVVLVALVGFFLYKGKDSISNIFSSISSSSNLASVYTPPAPNGQLTISSPVANATVSNSIDLSVQVGSVPGIAKVQYLLNGKPMFDYKSGELIDVVATAPYTYSSWSTKNVWNGNMTLQAVALDAAGTAIASSAEIPFKIANGTETATLLSPVSGSTVSGIINWSINTNVSVDGIYFAVDGVKEDLQFYSGVPSSNPTYKLDTTKYSNGKHELYVGVYAHNGRGAAMSQVMVNFDNGRSPMELRSLYSDSYLIPGENVSLSPKLIYTDGSSSAAAASFTSSNTSVATVNSSGVVSAKGTGIATISMSAEGKTASTRIVVTSSHAFSHFSKDGKILTSYTPGSSMFLRSLYVLDRGELNYNAALGTAVQAAGVNAFEGGIYLLPQDAGNANNFATYKEHFDRYWQNMQDLGNKYNLSLVLTGDNIARGPENIYRVLNEPWAAEALKYSFTKARDSGRAVAVEMIDESSGMWGSTPKPSTDWQKNCGVYGNCTIPKDAFTKLVNLIDQVPNHTPISWPILWLSGAKAASNWMGDPSIADYGSQYWDVNDWHRMYPRGSSLPQYKTFGLDNAVVGYLPGMQIEKPIIMNVSIAGPYYTKNGPGNNFVPGQDYLQDGGHWAASVSAQSMYAVAMGLSGVRGYQFDFGVWKNERQNSKVGSVNLQTGTDPFGEGAERWKAISTTFNFIKQIEPYILQPMGNALNLGSTITTGVHSGPNGVAVIAVNFSELPQTIAADLSVYSPNSAINRYRLLGSSLKQESVTLSQAGKMTLAPGESVVWLFNSDNVPVITPPVIPPVATTTPVVPVPVAPVVSLSASGASFVAPASLTLSAVATDKDGTISKVEFYNGSTLLSTDSSAPYAFGWNGLSQGNYTVTAKAYDNAGLSSMSSSTKITVTAPVVVEPPVVTSPTTPTTPSTPIAGFVKGVNLGGSPVKIDGNDWLSYGTALNSGLTISSGQPWSSTYNFSLTPTPDSAVLSMLSSNVWQSGTSKGKGVSMSQEVGNGTYNLYVWMIENYKDNYRSVDLRVNGQSAAVGIGDLKKGEWKRYGPYPVSVTTGKLTIEALNGGKGDPTISGFALFGSGTTLPPVSTPTTPTTPTPPVTPPVVTPPVVVIPPVTPPTNTTNFVLGVNLSGPSVTIEGNKWKSYQDAVTGGLMTQTSQTWSSTYSFALDPAADADTKLMLQSVLARTGPSMGQGFGITQPIQNGNYQVYVWSLENYRDNYRLYDIKINSQTVATAVGEMKLGHWEKYGPYPVSVTNGKLQIDVIANKKGDPLLAGFAVFSAGASAQASSLSQLGAVFGSMMSVQSILILLALIVVASLVWTGVKRKTHI